MSDINFTVSGTYNSIIEFIYDIEDDDRLGFEIKNFKMSKVVLEYKQHLVL